MNKKTQRKAFYKSLVEDYPSHEFAIDFREAQALNFAVVQASTELEDMFDEFRLCAGRVRSYLGVVPMKQEGEEST